MENYELKGEKVKAFAKMKTKKNVEQEEEEEENKKIDAFFEVEDVG